MHFIAIEGIPDLHTSPRPTFSLEGPEVTVDLDDVSGERLQLRFRPYQAARVTTEDCFMIPSGLDLRPRRVVEIGDSPWLQELGAVLYRHDHSATFMQRSRHFLLLAGDRFIEVAAWGVVWNGASTRGAYPRQEAAPEP